MAIKDTKKIQLYVVISYKLIIHIFWSDTHSNKSQNLFTIFRPTSHSTNVEIDNLANGFVGKDAWSRTIFDIPAYNYKYYLLQQF